MKEKELNNIFILPVRILFSLIELPFKIIQLIGFLIYKPMEFIVEKLNFQFHKYNCFILRHADEVKTIKNRDMLAEFGFTDEEIEKIQKSNQKKPKDHECDCTHVGCHINYNKRWCHLFNKEISNNRCNNYCTGYYKEEQNN